MAKESCFISSKLPWKQFKAKYDIEWEDRQKKQGTVANGTGNPFVNTRNDKSGKDAENEENN